MSVHRPPSRSTTGPESGPGDQADRAVRREHEPDDAEPDAADVVQVDEQEREDDPVPERVREAAELEDLHLAR